VCVQDFSSPVKKYLVDMFELDPLSSLQITSGRTFNSGEYGLAVTVHNQMRDLEREIFLQSRSLLEKIAVDIRIEILNVTALVCDQLNAYHHQLHDEISGIIAGIAFDRVFDELILDQMNEIGFRDAAYPMLLADARAGRNRDFIRELVCAAFPTVAFQLLTPAERNALPDEHVQDFGQYCMVCFAPIDALDDTVSSAICCGTDNTILCSDCRPGVAEGHRTGRITHEPENPGDPPPPFRLSGNWHVVQNLVRSRAAFNDG
jgi:hypothetical protein